MTADHWVFYLGNAIVAPVWLLMLLAPRWPVTSKLAGSLIAPALVGVVYLALVLTNVGATDGDFFSLEGVLLLFDDDRVVLTGWMHYLSIDLVVGAWIHRDAEKLGLRHALVAPCLLATLMYGPIGLCAYLLVRAVKTRSVAAMIP
jgi:hypothetical protein